MHGGGSYNPGGCALPIAGWISLLRMSSPSRWWNVLGRMIRVKAAYPHRFFVLTKSAWP